MNDITGFLETGYEAYCEHATSLPLSSFSMEHQLHGRNWTKVFCRTLSADLVFAYTDAGSALAHRRTSQDDDFSEAVCSVVRRRSWLELKETENPKIADLCFAPRAMAYERAFFPTTKGRMGLGNPQVGDEIWVLLGGVVPFILRPDHDYLSHVLVGDCFVDGLMDGEAMSDLEKKKQIVTLR